MQEVPSPTKNFVNVTHFPLNWPQFASLLKAFIRLLFYVGVPSLFSKLVTCANLVSAKYHGNRATFRLFLLLPEMRTKHSCRFIRGVRLETRLSLRCRCGRYLPHKHLFEGRPPFHELLRHTSLPHRSLSHRTFYEYPEWKRNGLILSL